MQLVITVEFKILNRINDVEADEPQHHRRRHNGGQESAVSQRVFNVRRKIKRTIHRQPRANRGDGQRDAEEDVREIGKSFRE